LWFVGCLSVGAILVAAVACYNPALQSPGLYCMPNAEPACPDGQVCSNNRCVDPRTAIDGGGNRDFGNTPQGDMRTNNPRDMATVGTGCGAIVSCFNACMTQSCADACVSSAPTAAQDLWGMAIGCGQQYCYDAFQCDLDSTQTQLVDPIGAPAGTCNNCLNDSLSGLFGNSCAGTTHCNPTMCRSGYTACLND
jgi:hypothetical protein